MILGWAQETKEKHKNTRKNEIAGKNKSAGKNNGAPGKELGDFETQEKNKKAGKEIRTQEKIRWGPRKLQEKIRVQEKISHIAGNS